MDIADTDIDFDFETGEIIQDHQFDVIDFCAKISHHCGTVTINHWVKIPRSLKIPLITRSLKGPLINRISIKYVGDVPIPSTQSRSRYQCPFPARGITKTRRPWDGRPPVYVHESL